MPTETVSLMEIITVPSDQPVVMVVSLDNRVRVLIFDGDPRIEMEDSELEKEFGDRLIGYRYYNKPPQDNCLTTLI